MERNLGLSSSGLPPLAEVSEAIDLGVLQRDGVPPIGA